MASQMFIVLLIATAYLVGAIPFGLILVRWIARKDIRTVGSGNIGATNARRAAGTPAALCVLACDLIKGALPVIAARWLTGPSEPASWIAAATALAAIAGHMFPVYLRFRPSGKGIATALGAFLILAPMAVLVAALVFILLVTVSRRVSVGSITAVIALTPAVWWTTHEPATTTAAALAAALILIRHKENIQRLRQGHEPRLNNNQ